VTGTGLREVAKAADELATPRLIGTKYQAGLPGKRPYGALLGEEEGGPRLASKKAKKPPEGRPRFTWLDEEQVCLPRLVLGERQDIR